MKPIFFAILAGFSWLPVSSQDISGSWQGYIAAGGGNTRFILNSSKSGNKHFRTMPLASLNHLLQTGV